MAYSIKEIADLAGLTTRTMRYYDQIGLLRPAQIGANGYRFYDQASLLKLQQICFFRELDVPLKDIQLILDQPDFNLLDALNEHRLALQGRQKRINQLIHTVDQTIAAIKGINHMNEKDYFDGFDESDYEEEARQRWGDTPAYAESQRKWAGFSKEQREAIKAEGGHITTRMAGEDADAAPDSADVQAAIGDYLAYLSKYFYACDVAFLRNLADMWVADPRFAANYERIRVSSAEFVRKAVHIYCDQNQ